ncbi:MAG: hypothetical protein EOO03_06340 [Chitinophagaceae bacterium]|nr:MAG: hypothetical protein EOO03_06340 [Chitinophagaceae bacterium]
MKKLLFLLIIVIISNSAFAQNSSTELYDLIVKFMYDSTGYESVGDWGVGKPKKFPVAWKTDRIEMSDDTSINFFRSGTADISIKGKKIATSNNTAAWRIMLKGPRMGYSSYSIISVPSKDFAPRYTIDSLFSKKKFKATLLKKCDHKDLAGYYYYEVKVPGKDPAFIKFSWLYIQGNTAVRIDGYDSWSKYAVKLDCPK